MNRTPKEIKKDVLTTFRIVIEAMPEESFKNFHESMFFISRLLFQASVTILEKEGNK